MKISWIAIPSVLSTLAAIGLGLFVLSRNTSGLRQRIFSGGMAALALMELGNSLLLLSSVSTYLFMKRLSLIGEILMPLIWLVFSLLFARGDPKEVVGRWRTWLLVILLLSIIFLFFLGSDSFVYFRPSGDLRLGHIGQGFYIYLLLSSLLILSRLENIFRSSSESQWWQTKFLIFGIGTIFSFTIYISGQILLYSTIIIKLIPIHSFLMLFSFGMIAFSIIRHGNLEANIFVSRHVVYGSAMVIIIGFYIFVVGLIANILGTFGNRINPFLAPLIVMFLIVGFVIFLSSGLVRRRLKLFISKHFYKHKYDFHLKWLEATEKLGSKRTIQELSSALTDFLKETLGAKDVYLFIFEKERMKFAGANMRLSFNKSVLDFLKEHSSPMAISDMPQGSEFAEINELCSKMGGDLLTPLIANDNLIGFIIIGPDITGNLYVQNDYDILKAVGKQISYQLLNARMTDDLATAKQLEGLHEMSTFVIHEIKNLSMTLSLMIQNAEAHFDKPDFRKEALKTLSQILAKLKAFTLRLSSFSRALGPEKSKVDINALIDETLISLNSSIKAEVSRDLHPLLPLIEIDQNQIKEVLINLLMNAQEALGPGGKIKISTSLEDNFIILSVSDNGCGIPPPFIQDQLFKPFRTTKPNGLGIGLFHTKKIIEAHEGSIVVKSNEGSGTIFHIRLPLGKARE